MTTAAAPASGALVRGRRPVVLALARIEARRLLTHPVMPAGLLFAVLFAREISGQTPWSGAAYSGLPVAFGPLMLAISFASAAAFLRDRHPVAESAPVAHADRALPRLLAGAPVVAAVAVLTAAGAAWLRVRGGLDLGDEPGRTLHAHFTLPEILQPVALAVFAVAFGPAVARVVRSRLATAVVLFVVWFLVSSGYWLFNGETARLFALIQTQPVVVPVAPTTADPFTLPDSWLLSQPGQYQDFWGRVVVSPSMAAWHDVYLLGLALLAAAVVLSGATRRRVAVAGLVVAALAVAAQALVHP